MTRRPLRLTDEGGTYVLEVDRPLTQMELERIKRGWQSSTGAKLVVLDNGVRLARDRRVCPETRGALLITVLIFLLMWLACAIAYAVTGVPG